MKIFVVRTYKILYGLNCSGERSLKIGPHLPNLLSNIKRLTFLRHRVIDLHTPYSRVSFRMTLSDLAKYSMT